MAISGERAAALLESGLGLHAELSLPALLRLVVEQTVALMGAEQAALELLSPDGTRLDEPITSGDGDQHVTTLEAQPASPSGRFSLRAPVITGDGDVLGKLTVSGTPGGGEFTEEDEASLVVIASQAGIAIANARLHEENRKHAQWLDAVRAVATGLLVGEDILPVVRLVAERAAALSGADIATVSVADKDRLRIVASSGVPSEDLADLDVPLLGTLSDRVLQSGEPLRIADAAASGMVQPLAERAGVGPMILLPMVLRTGERGVLAVGRSAGRKPFDPGEVPPLRGFAEQAAVVIEFGRARAELARFTLMEDRERIARELHDGVIQSLFAVGLSLQAAAATLGVAPAAAPIQEAVTEIDSVIDDLRNYIFGLRPAVLAGGNLAEGLELLAHEYRRRAGLAIVVDVDPSLEQPLAPVALHVVQMVREALSNVGRHAEAHTCRVSVRRNGTGAVIEVDDDGLGFDAAHTTEGLGLRNLRSRAETLRGAFSIQSSATEGTQARITLPL